MGLVIYLLQKIIGWVRLAFVCWLIGLNVLHTDLYGQDIESLVEPEHNAQPLTTSFPMLIKAEKRTDRLRASATYYRINQRRGIQAQNGDNIITLAFYGDVTVNAFLRFNDITDLRTLIRPGQVYYLQAKARRAKAPFHVIQRNQTLLDVSNMYGVRLKSLLKFNRLDSAQRLPAGRILWLQSKRPAKQPVVDVHQEPTQNAPLLRDFVWTPTETTPVSVDRPLRSVADSLSVNKTLVAKKAKLSKSRPNALASQFPQRVPLTRSVHTSLARKTIFHTVKAGQTLYRIALLNQVRVRDLIAWNKLKSITINIGQRLVIR